MHTAHTVVKAYMVRMCIGRKVAELEMFTLLAAIITRFQVEIITTTTTTTTTTTKSRV